MAGVFGASPDHATLAILAGFATAIAIGIGCGLANGIGVSYLNVNPFIVTLATASVFQGFTLLVKLLEEFTEQSKYYFTIYKIYGLLLMPRDRPVPRNIKML